MALLTLAQISAGGHGLIYSPKVTTWNKNTLLLFTAVCPDKSPLNTVTYKDETVKTERGEKHPGDTNNRESFLSEMNPGYFFKKVSPFSLSHRCQVVWCTI